ncbi:MAG: DUF4382 domain-containing protein [Candidatus Micrarchaeota archaeon]|nr:DUF4382 domain-containing protein [Candidatus Micrarchaeota archaeon]
METKKMPALFAVALVAAISFFAAGCTQNGETASPSQGRVVFTMTDAAADMGAVASVKVTVDSLEVQNATGGWIIVASPPYTYDLLQLKASGSQPLMADASLAAGAYGQVRMHISKVVIADSSGEHEATLPSGDLKIIGGFMVKANSTTVVNFDFQADKSVHVTGNGKYILAPVVHMQGLDGAEVDTSSKWNVKVIGGRISTDTEVGMGADGKVGVGAGIPANANLTIDSGGIVVLGLGRIYNAEPSPGNGDAYSGNVTGQAGITDLTACIAISGSQQRLACIAMWCGSEARDYKMCYSLIDENDRLGCLNKCNPNSNI